MVFKQLQELFENGVNKVKSGFGLGKKGFTLSEKTLNKMIEAVRLFLEILEEAEVEVKELKEDAEELVEVEE